MVAAMVRALTIKFIPTISPIAMGEDSGALFRRSGPQASLKTRSSVGSSAESFGSARV